MALMWWLTTFVLMTCLTNCWKGLKYWLNGAMCQCHVMSVLYKIHISNSLTESVDTYVVHDWGEAGGVALGTETQHVENISSEYENICLLSPPPSRHNATCDERCFYQTGNFPMSINFIFWMKFCSLTSWWPVRHGRPSPLTADLDWQWSVREASRHYIVTFVFLTNWDLMDSKPSRYQILLIGKSWRLQPIPITKLKFL